MTQFEIVAGNYPTKLTEIAVRTSSVISVMDWLSKNYVLVPKNLPADDSPKPLGFPSERDPLKVSSGPQKPADAYAAIKYRGHWFWIDWQDGAQSKQSMVILRTLLALADTSARPAAPVLTIPTR